MVENRLKLGKIIVGHIEDVPSTKVARFYNPLGRLTHMIVMEDQESDDPILESMYKWIEKNCSAVLLEVKDNGGK